MYFRKKMQGNQNKPGLWDVCKFRSQNSSLWIQGTFWWMTGRENLGTLSLVKSLLRFINNAQEHFRKVTGKRKNLIVQWPICMRTWISGKFSKGAKQMLSNKNFPFLHLDSITPPIGTVMVVVTVIKRESQFSEWLIPTESASLLMCN